MKLNRFIVACMTVLILTIAVLGINANLFAQSSDVTVSLSWNANTESDLAGYKVYRGQGTLQCSGSAALPALTTSGTPVRVLKPSISYTDSSVPRVEGPVCYELSAYDTSSNESGRSNRAQVVLNVNPPSSPQNLQVVIP
jgi:septal ring-binding cell division protein DamX